MLEEENQDTENFEMFTCSNWYEDISLAEKERLSDSELLEKFEESLNNI